jgi:hypothetical protein
MEYTAALAFAPLIELMNTQFFLPMQKVRIDRSLAYLDI